MEWEERKAIMQECVELSVNVLDKDLQIYPIDASVNLDDTHNFCISVAVTAREDLFGVTDYMNQFYLPAIVRLADYIKDKMKDKKFTMFPMLFMPDIVSVLASKNNTHLRIYRGYDISTRQSTVNVDVHVVSLGE